MDSRPSGVRLVALAAGLIALAFVPDRSAAADPAAECLRRMLENPAATGSIRFGNQALYATQTLPGFYELRGFELAWLDPSTKRPTAPQALLRAIQGADSNGLRPSDYHLAWLKREVDQLEHGRLGPCGLANLELALSDAFLILAAHMLAGRVNPESIHSEWMARPREGKPLELLDRVLREGDVAQRLSDLQPNAAGYRRLARALARYRSILSSGGWQSIGFGPVLKVGDEDVRVAALAHRLRATGDVPRTEPVSETRFDDALSAAVGRFQFRHGLRRSGALDSSTVQALDVGVDERVEQIELNLERWRWLPQELGDRRVMVNIAGFELEVIEGETRVFQSTAIVGRTYRRTPVFSDEISYLVFSPYWHVPPSIARNDILPAVMRDPGYLERKGFKVFEGWGADEKPVDPSSIEWKNVAGGSLPYRFRQDPGAGNALGPVKIMFPNRFNVYLHGTPAQDLFEEEVRALSSGCIRLARPLELAQYLLADDPSWNWRRIQEAAGSGKEMTVRLPSRTPVHLLYWTAWVDPDETVHLRRDVYERDAALRSALFDVPPQTTP